MSQFLLYQSEHGELVREPTVRLFRTTDKKISADLAKSHAEREFTEFRIAEDGLMESDFDPAIQQHPPPQAS